MMVKWLRFTLMFPLLVVIAAAPLSLGKIKRSVYSTPANSIGPSPKVLTYTTTSLPEHTSKGFINPSKIIYMPKGHAVAKIISKKDSVSCLQCIFTIFPRRR